jgi:hypothetical protein
VSLDGAALLPQLSSDPAAPSSSVLTTVGAGYPSPVGVGPPVAVPP